jgi:hypothetical protein
MLIRPYLRMPPRGRLLNRNDPIVRKLVMCVPFNEGTGANAWDLVHGFKGDIRSNTLWDASPLGACLHFQGNTSTDGIDLIDHEVFDFGSDDFFLSVMVQRLASGTAWHQLITKDASGARSFCFEFYYNTDLVRILTFNSGSPYSLQSNTAITDTNCHHILAQRIGTTLQIWIDGKLDASNTSGNYGSTDTSTTPITLGRRNYPGYESPLNGRMFMPMAGRGHLQPEEIRRLYAEPFSIFEPRKIYTSGGAPPGTTYNQDYRILSALSARQGTRLLNALSGANAIRLKSGLAAAVTTRLKNAKAAAAHYRLKILAPAGKNWRLLNAVPATVDRRLLNRLAAGMAKDARLRNRIAGLYQTDTRLRNAIEGTARYIRDIGLRNLLLPASAARHVSNTWDAAIAGTSIKDHCRHLRIMLHESSFTNEVEIDVELGTIHGAALSPADLIALVRSNKGTGQDALAVTIDGTSYRFMIEETTREHTPPAMTVWGRSLTAKLADPFYSKPVSKTWDTPTLASNIVAELAPGFTVDFQIEDFVVPAGVLSAENDMPLDVIREIAERSQGALVRSGIAGELILRPRRPTAPRDIKAATPAATWWDGDDLLSLSDDFEPAEGWNAVTVKGKTSIAGAGIYVELDSERNNKRTTFLPGQDAFVRVYTSPIGAAYEHQVTMGTATKLGTYEQVFEDEEIQVQDGRAGTRYPILSVQALDFDGRVLSGPEWEQGGKEIRFNVAEGCSGSAYLKLDYSARYDLWKVKVDSAGKAILCLEEQ